MAITNTIFRKISHIIKKPIPVFCFHHVTNSFNPRWMFECDVISIDDFIAKINEYILKGYSFITLSEAYFHIENDIIRRKKYAVLTFDDGYQTLFQILPWLKKNMIPVTLFITCSFLDGKTYRNVPEEKYLTYSMLSEMEDEFSIEICSHGWSHNRVSSMPIEEFESSVNNCIEVLSKYKKFASFYAYPYGDHTASTDSVLKRKGIIPVLIDGMNDYCDSSRIHRMLIK